MHKIECYVRPPATAQSSATFSGHEIQGILFPEDEDFPRLIKVKCLGGYNRDGSWWQTQNLRPYLPDDKHKGRGYLRIDGPFVPSEGGIQLGTMIDIFDTRAFTNGSKVNRCIQRLTNGKVARPWAGNFVSFRGTHVNQSMAAVLDQDLPVLVKYFTSGVGGRQ